MRLVGAITMGFRSDLDKAAEIATRDMVELLVTERSTICTSMQ